MLGSCIVGWVPKKNSVSVGLQTRVQFKAVSVTSLHSQLIPITCFIISCHIISNSCNMNYETKQLKETNYILNMKKK